MGHSHGFGEPKLRFKREKNSEPVSKDQHYKDSIYKMTMQGFPDFEVREHKIGKTTYIVTRCFCANGEETIETAMCRYVLGELEKEHGDKAPLSIKDKEEIINNVR